MTVTVTANGLTISHKGSGGWVRNTTPDVCRSPDKPIPYNIVSYSRDLVRGTRTVFADGGRSVSVKGSAYATCTGDEPGTGLGVTSSTHLHEATWITYSPNVFAEGRNICRKTDKMFMNNRNCVSAAGDYEPPLSVKDPLERALCRIFCKARQEWHACRSAGGKQCEKPSKTAERRLKAQQRSIDDLVSKKYGKGFTGTSEKTYFAKLSDKLKGALGESGRKIYSEKALRESLQRRLRNKLGKELGEKAVKKAGTIWLKAIPGLNVLSTLYDVYDLAMTAKEFYDLAQEHIKALDTEAVKIKPDVGIEGPDGSLQDTYDFKFDAPGYKDDFKNGQAEIYEDASGKRPKTIDDAKCQCDAKTGGPAAPMV